MSPAVSGGLAGFIVGAVPHPAALEAAETTLRTAVAVARAEQSGPEAVAALAAARTYGGPAQASLLGRSERIPATWAAFVNGVTTRSPVVCSALALAELGAESGQLLLEAIAVGLEAGRRVEQALAADPARRAWPEGAIADWLGAAAAAGRVAGLSVAEQVAALALSATQVAGMSAAAGSRIRFGKAAFDAVESTLLAGAGFTGAALPIEGRRGLAALTAPGAALEGLLDGLGDGWAKAGPGAPVTGRTVAELIAAGAE